ncbi:MAG: serine/threonine-protein kinase [Planctomycetota bacterium]
MSIESDPEFDLAEQQLAVIITDYADRANAGEPVSLEAAVRKHPKFETDLRELWGTIVITRAAAQENRNAPLPSSTEMAMPRLELPCQFADYILEAEIGRGGMGIVYRAIRQSDNEPVAIKMILKGDFASEAEQKRFDAEALAAAKLNHPNIIPIFEIGEFEGRSFFCMKLIQGQSLAERLIRGPMPTDRAARVMKDISSAIAYAHSQGILHRDLKPSNIMLDDEGIAYVADFGLAKVLDAHQASLTRTGAVLGTPSYMAPEQAAGERGTISATTDVYSLGAVLYHILTGRPPFLGSSPIETVMMVLETDPVAPRAINQRADRQLDMICMRCMQKPPDLRYTTAKDLSQDIEAFIDKRPIAANMGRFGQVIGNLFRETHHAVVLENWGLLWMWHSLVLLVSCILTELMFWAGNKTRWQYWLMWTLGVGAWAIIFWMIRRRMGPVTFVERQIAHVWAAAMCCVAFLFPLEIVLDLPVLSMAPMLGVVAAMVFLAKAGMLSGTFYIHSVTMFLTAIAMMFLDDYAMLLFGVISAACFFLAGLKYYRKRKRQLDRLSNANLTAH